MSDWKDGKEVADIVEARESLSELTRINLSLFLYFEILMESTSIYSVKLGKPRSNEYNNYPSK